MKGRTPTKSEREYMEAIREIGCIACVKSGLARPFSTPSEYTAIHHIDGKTKPDAHFKTIPLCPEHHQQGRNAIHVSRKSFERDFGTEEELRDLVTTFL